MHSDAWSFAVPLLAPLSLVAVWVLSFRQPGLRPRLVLEASGMAALVTLLSAALAVALLLWNGPVVFTLRGIPLLRLDALSVVMFALIATLGGVVVRYSLRYLDGDPRQGKFLGNLALTIAAVSVLVTSATIVQLLAAWVATSLALHRLLLFYPDRSGAVLAARKKFVMARLGDLCLAAAALLLVRAFGTVDLGEMLAAARAAGAGAPSGVALAGSLLALAAALKSAQFPTHGWLVEMMETPTPVSALLHAGILNGGVFLVVRLAEVVLLSPGALHALIVVGGFTAVFSSMVMVTQPSVKVALAYSSAAHMGFMLMVCGLRVWPMAIMHLVAHSFYKAHAFLSSGSAVEVARTAPARTTGHLPGLLVGAFALSVLTVAGAGALFGMSLTHDAAQLGLAATLAIGLTQLLAQGVKPGSNAKVLGRTVLASAATAAAFFGLERVAGHVLGGAVPLPTAPDPASVALMALVVLGFAAAMALQLRLPALTGSPRAAVFWVHLRNGFYANTLFDRLLEPRLPAVRADGSGDPRPLPLRAPTPIDLSAALERACRTVAPVWPLRSFVAVNPFLGLADLPFAEAALRLQRTAGARLTMPRAYYAQAFREGRLTQEHLATALAQAPLRPAVPRDAGELVALLGREAPQSPPRPFPTVADVISELTGADHARLLTERLSAWAAGYFDKGQSSWRSPWQALGPYAAWHAEAQHDRSPEVLGVKDARATVRGLPGEAGEAAIAALARLGVPAEMLGLYLERLLATLSGWAAVARYRGWNAELNGGRDGTLPELLAVRLGWEVALLEGVPGARTAWAEAVRKLSTGTSADGGLAVDLVLHEAFEHAYRETLVDRIRSTPRPTGARPPVQAVFCIDVRSERLRRHLEAVSPGTETLGFAGFFGFALEYVPLGQTRGMAQCPVLLTPGVVIRETVEGATDDDVARAGASRTVRRKVAQAWKSFKQGAVSCFAFVGPVGLMYLPKLLGDAFGLTRPVPHPGYDGLPASVRQRLGPTLTAAESQGRATGLPPAARLDAAEAVLRAMSLSRGPLGRLVVLAGHGSSTVNNPHATGLDCGACGGHTGEANARVAAAVLNDVAVHAGLKARGIEVPADTVFVPALHDTTTDEVVMYDDGAVPATHRSELDTLRRALAEAGRRTRLERAPSLGLAPGVGLDAAILARSRDWAQVRPEWALAGCAAFVAAPRHRTASLDLQGRAFLHSYAWEQDEGFGVLELILTAPVVVASWISLQYFGSTVDNRAFGSGNKVLHNVVGTLGVLEGNGGDLRTGLPWQSVHDGERFVHEPVRLNVLVEAPVEAMNAVLQKHAGLRALVDNGWLHLHRLDEDGVVSHRYTGALVWEPLRPRAQVAA